jgi:acyl-coenzyme A synthetase/AMP-(fatty) acid ligase
MKRVALCVPDPWNYISQYSNYSLVIINPAEPLARKQYLLDKADWSLLVTPGNIEKRFGNDYSNERIVLCTSGTTGDSKMYGFSADKVQYSIDNIVGSYDLTSNDRYLSVMPLWHAHGLLMYLAAQSAGCEIKMASVGDFKNAIDFQPTYLSAIPDFLKLATKQNFNTLRFVRSASMALPEATYLGLKQRWSVPVIEAFGMTETCSHCFTNPIHGPQKIGTIGRPSGIEFYIDQGKLFLKGQSAYTNEWFDTGDLADQDLDGYVRILGRSIDRINIRGYKIDPLSIENQLYNCIPEIGDVVVFGTDRLMCIYTGDIDPAVVKKQLLSISPYCYPKLLEQVTSIPKNAAGKTSRTLLNRMYNLL